VGELRRQSGDSFNNTLLHRSDCLTTASSSSAVALLSQAHEELVPTDDVVRLAFHSTLQAMLATYLYRCLYHLSAIEGLLSIASEPCQKVAKGGDVSGHRNVAGAQFDYQLLETGGTQGESVHVPDHTAEAAILLQT